MRFAFVCCVAALLVWLGPGGRPAARAQQLAAAVPAPGAAGAAQVQALIAQSRDEFGNDTEVALRTVQRALALAHRLGQPRLVSDCLAFAGDYYLALGATAQGQASFEGALAAARQAGWVEGLGNAYMGLYALAYDQNDYPTSLRWLHQASRYYAAVPAAALPAATRLDYQMLVCVNLSAVYTELHQPALAARATRRGLALAAHGARPVRLAVLLQNLGDVQLSAHFPDSARATLRRALALTSNQAYRAAIRARLAHCELALGHPAEAHQQALRAHRLARASGSVVSRSDALEVLAQTLAALHRPEAYDTLRRYLALHDTLLAQARTEAVVQAQARFHSQEQQAQIRTLRQDRRLSAQARELARLRTRQERAGAGALALLLLAGGGALFARYRRRQAAARAADAARLRQRLAADLHDDVGNLLTQISMQSSLLREAPGSPAQLLARLDQLTTTARQATQGMADVVWGLHQPTHSLPELLDRMRDHAHEVCFPLGLEVDFEARPAAAAAVRLAPEALQSLYLIFKESLHNVVKHAQATRVTVRLGHSPAGLRLTVADNGHGPDDSARPAGNGLRNMQARARAVGGTVRYEALAPGFAVVVELPEAVAA